MGSKNDLSSGFLSVGKVKIHIELTNSLSLKNTKKITNVFWYKNLLKKTLN